MRINGNRRSGALLGLAVAMVCQGTAAQEIEEIIVTARRQGEEKLMDTPLAITAFDADAIESKGINNLQDVANLTPGLSFFSPLGEALPTPVIRGVVPQDIFGENAAAIFVDGVYVAGREGLNFSQLDIARIEVMKGPQSATYGRNAFSGAINYVTKAPSDVFESRFEGDVGNRGKQRLMGQVSGPIFGDTLTGRVSVLYDEWDGSYDNTLAPENDIGGYRYRSYQGKLRWRPTETLDIDWAIYRSNDEIDDFAVAGVLANCEDKVLQTSKDAADGAGPGPRLQNFCGELPKLRSLPKALDPTQFPNAVPLPDSISRDSMPKLAQGTGEDRDLVRSNLNIAWDTDYGSLMSLTGYSYMKEQMVVDFGRSLGNASPLVYCTGSTNDAPGLPAICNPPYTNWSRVPMGFVDIEPGPTVEEWSQELRFTSPRDARLRWQAGGYYFHSVLKDRKGNPAAATPLPPGLDFTYNGDIAFGPIGLPSSFAIGSYIIAPSLDPYGGLDPLDRPVLKSTGKSWSLFGAVDFDVTDKLQSRAELRYTQDHKHASAFNHTPCLSPTPGSLYPLAPDLPVADCGNTFWDLRELEPAGYWNPHVKDKYDAYVGAWIPGVESSSERFDNWTGRVGLNYKLDSGWMVYGSVAYGEKPGGINVLPSKEIVSPSPGIITVFNDFDPEKMTAYELGLKGYTSDRRIRLDFAIFYNDWRDIVLRQLTEVAPTGERFRQPQGINVNSGDARVFGWELTTDIGLTENLTGRLTVGYTDSTMKSGNLESLAQFPSFYTSEPSCDPALIQAIADPDPLTKDNEAQTTKAAQCRAISGDISGTTQMRQPEWTSSLSLDYRRQLVGDWNLNSSLSGSYTGKTYVGNDNQGWTPANSNVNFSIGAESPRYTVQFWVRNLLDKDEPRSAYRDIFWSNDSDIYATVPAGSTSVRDVSNFDDFPPMRLVVSYPSLRTFGINAKMRFGGAEK